MLVSALSALSLTLLTMCCPLGGRGAKLGGHCPDWPPGGRVFGLTLTLKQFF